MRDLVTSQKSLRGIALMVIAMLLIPVVDTTAKWLSSGHSPLMLGWVRYAAASAIVLPLAARVHGWAMFPQRNLMLHGLRTLFLVTAMTLYFLAISRIPLSTAVAAYFVGPIIAVVLATAFLNERLTRSKMISLGLGVVGALVVLNPRETIELGVILALGAGFFFALYLVSTRAAAQDGGALRTLAFQCAFGAVLLSPQAAFTWSLPNYQDIGLFMFMGLVSAISHILVIRAFAQAEASILAPLVYVELIGALCLGLFVFGEVPSRYALFGGGLIVLAGLVLIIRREPD